MSDELWRGYDAIGFDLDGVIYRGTSVIPAAPGVIETLRRAGVRVGFVTNNANLGPDAICQTLAGLGIGASPSEVVTSAQATARLMADALPGGATVMCVGSQSLADEITAVGLRPLPPAPGKVDAVCVGFSPDLTWADLNEGCYAVQSGAAYFACNGDLSRPTDRGLAVGTGGVLAAMGLTMPERAPVMGGKPASALFDEARRRLGAQRPLFVGDRLDTDVAGANRAGWASLLVLSGATDRSGLMLADGDSRPTYIADDVGGLLQPPQRTCLG